MCVQVITPCRRLILCADNRKEMEEWMAALRSIQNRQNYEVSTPVCPPALSPSKSSWLWLCVSQSTQYSMDHFSGMHNWYACSHARPTYCNVCREALSGVTSHGLSCEGTHCTQSNRVEGKLMIWSTIPGPQNLFWLKPSWWWGNLSVYPSGPPADETKGQ